MPYLNLAQVPIPKDLSNPKGQTEYLKQLYDLLCKWRQLIVTIDIQGGGGFVTVSDSAPTDDQGQNQDIWVEYEES